MDDPQGNAGSRAGYILVGGKSSRMGQDKALMPYRGEVLVSRIAREVETAAGSATLVGAPDRYKHLGWPVVADARTECGPLAGIETALRHTRANWNLIVACDMPGLNSALLANLFVEAAERDCDCLMPVAPNDRPEPLCAIWHRRCLAAVEWALDNNVRKITDALGALRAARLESFKAAPEAAGWAANLNTPEEWHSHLNAVKEH